MLRENNYILRQVNLAVDFALGLAALLLAHGMRHLLSVWVISDHIGPASMDKYAWPIFSLPLLTVLVLAYNGFYKSHRLRSRVRDLIKTLAVSCIEITILLMVVIYIFWRGNIVSRPLIFLVPFALFFVLAVKTYVMRRTLMWIRQRGYNFRRVVLVGSGEPLRQFIENLEAHPIWGLRVEAVITDRPEEWEIARKGRNPRSLGYPLIGDLARGGEALEKRQTDEVVFVPEAASLGALAPLMEICEEMGIRTHLPLHYFQGHIARPMLDYFDDIPVISYWPTREIGPALLFKYAFDRVFGFLLLALFSPVCLAAAVAVKLTSRKGEPIFFKQVRLGLNGRKFVFWKFRTMYVDAARRLEEIRHLNEADGPVFKMKDDPRITPVGRFLRKFSIDELPQLWNVVRGEMSLVGPRPPLPEEAKKYNRWQRRRLSMKPGITCLWQVQGRHRVSFDTWMNLDLHYIDNWSLLLDFKILVRTVFAVITGQGAM